MADISSVVAASARIRAAVAAFERESRGNTDWFVDDFSEDEESDMEMDDEESDTEMYDEVSRNTIHEELHSSAHADIAASH
jgi:hypothetical protein